MKTTNAIDAARVELLLAELRLPAVKLVWANLAAQADKEGWPAPSALAAVSNAILPKRGCRPARLSTPSTSKRSPWLARIIHEAPGLAT